MKTVDTCTPCPVCNSGSIVAETEWSTSTPVEMIPIGPGSRAYYSPSILSFHCNNPKCLLIFHAPPGKPDAATSILSSMRQEQEDSD